MKGKTEKEHKTEEGTAGGKTQQLYKGKLIRLFAKALRLTGDKRREFLGIPCSQGSMAGLTQAMGGQKSLRICVTITQRDFC